MIITYSPSEETINRKNYYYGICTVVVFHEKSGGAGAEFPEYFRSRDKVLNFCNIDIE